MADDNHEHESKVVKYPFVHYEDVVFTDMSRYRDGCKVGNTACTDTTHGFRLIDVRIFRPAKNPGTGDTISVPLQPKVFSGSYPYYPNQPTVLSNIVFKQYLTWSNNQSIDTPLPLIVFMGGAPESTSWHGFGMVEHVAAAGFIVAVVSGYGSDFSACPTPQFCALAVNRTQQRDIRAVIDAAVNGELGFPGNQIKTDNQGVAITGCLGASAGGIYCERAAAGASAANANSLPGETLPDPRLRSVMSLDANATPGPSFNNQQFTAALGIYAHGVFENWPALFPVYSNASTRIFYDLRNSQHSGRAAMAPVCEFLNESIRVLQQGVNTAADDINIAVFGNAFLSSAFANCSSASLVGFEILTFPLPSTLSGLFPFSPSSGISAELPNGDFSQMNEYYLSQFFQATLNGDNAALQRATTPSFPGFIDNIYVNATPGFTGNNFNLQNKQIDIKFDKNRKTYNTTITSRSGPIADPSIEPGAYSLFGDALWDDEIIEVSRLAMGQFPLPKDNLVASTSSLNIYANGFVLPESSANSNDMYEPGRFKGWFSDRGSMAIACLGTDLANNIQAGDPVGGRIWVANTPDHFRVTWYNVFSYEFGSIVSVQCTLFRDGSIQIVNDDSVPAVLNADTGETGAMMVGLSNGRLHVKNNGTYDPSLKPKIVTFTDILNGGSSKNADAIFEEFSESRAPVGVQPPPFGK